LNFIFCLKQCLIVSEETQKGGLLVNEKRIENNLPEMRIHVVNLVKDEIKESADIDEDKISSSNNRRKLLGNLLKPPRIEFNPTKPYIIGLTGGVASGKSNIRKDLENLGVATIDCDQLGHATYLKGTETFNEIIKIFGQDIVDDQTGQIDRKKLGNKVFNDKIKLKSLTDIVWPQVHRLMREQIEILFQKGKKN
jgi:phosphopantetheine adenylyltransferase / dephospho-CoA kinase